MRRSLDAVRAAPSVLTFTDGNLDLTGLRMVEQGPRGESNGGGCGAVTPSRLRALTRTTEVPELAAAK